MCFSPTKRTWIQAVKKGHVKTWPGVTVDAIQHYLPMSEATMLGHLDQQRKNIQSTKLQDDDQDTMHTPSPLDKGLHTHVLYAATISYNQPTGKLFTNLTGRFPVQSSRGHKYILVAYNFDSNSIHVRPLKSRHDNDTIKAYEEIYSMLTQQGLKPQLHWLDNEASRALKTFITKEQTQYQLTPLHIHQRNAAEQAIRTFKNHFISGLCSVDKTFPLHLWCRLLDQVELTSICYARPGSTQTYPSTSSSTVSMISMQHLWHHQELSALPMRNPANMAHGLHMDSMDGTWGQRLSTIDVIKSTSQKHRAHEFVIQWSSFQPTATCPACHHT